MLAPNVSSFQNLLIVVINMVIPCLINAYCFAQIFCRIRKASSNLKNSNSKAPSHMNNQQASEIINLYSNTDSRPKGTATIRYSKNRPLNSVQREIKITKMFALIFLVFLFGYLPYGIWFSFKKRISLDYTFISI